MDIEKFITSQRNKLQVDKDNLTCNNSPDKEKIKNSKDVNCISKSKIKKSANNCNAIQEKQKHYNHKNANMDFLQKNNINVIDPTSSVEAGVQQLQSLRTTTANMCMNFSSMATSPMHNQQNSPHPNLVDQSDFHNNDHLGRKYCEQKHGSSFFKTAKNLANLNERQSADIAAVSQNRENKDDMEQWVSDTFYSYFPGFNNENKKRQEILHGRQLEYQQNFIKHQMNEANANSGKKKHTYSHLHEANIQKNISTDSNHKPLTTSRSSDKTDLEIIVNNPDNEGRSPRPGSARHKLLQDLKHTEISNIVNNDGVTERNRRNAEMEVAKKKDYQKELMAQIEEKRRSIEVLKEKERRQEEALTRKLQEQLKTMRLQEELEKEKMRADKVRFDSEQNRLMREHLLTKLENDTKLLSSARKTRSENEKTTPDENKVYKYFSNSARHEFRREPTHEPPAFHLDVPPSAASIRRKKCFHEINDSIICPYCDSTLKSYESWCLKCERRIFEIAETDLPLLVCENCKKLYSICPYCDKNEGRNCMHCQRNRNCCANCQKNLCSDCNYAISLGRDSKQKADSERSFEILEVSYPEDDDEDKPTSNDLNNNREQNRPPYSVNIDRNSIFHHDFDRSKLYNDENNIEVIRRETDKRLSRYFKNYGDLACKGLHDRSTQTTPDSASRRDIVMVEENNLSMPLLREMPRMTRKESNLQQAERRKKGTRIENLARRWEVPAVQKHTITTNSPKILTQLGAIRKQLQSEQLHLDFNENK